MSLARGGWGTTRCLYPIHFPFIVDRRRMSPKPIVFLVMGRRDGPRNLNGEDRFLKPKQIHDCMTELIVYASNARHRCVDELRIIILAEEGDECVQSILIWQVVYKGSNIVEIGELVDVAWLVVPCYAVVTLVCHNTPRNGHILKRFI